MCLAHGEKNVGWFVKDRHSRFMDASDNFAEMIKLEPGKIRENKSDDLHTPWANNADIIANADKDVLNGLKASGDTILFDTCRKSWRAITVKQISSSRTRMEGVVVETTQINRLIKYWNERYDYDNRCINAGSKRDIKLDMVDLYILRNYILGHQQKVTAHQISLSIKTVEKRLYRMKQLLIKEKPGSKTLQEVSGAMGLTRLLMCKKDLFDAQAVSRASVF